jgi:ATP-dependent DNA ligase
VGEAVIQLPMKANEVDIVPNDPDRWAMSVKWDGHRIFAGVHADGCWLESATGNRRNSVPYINKAVASMCPPDTILDGEVVDLMGARQWNRTQSILTRHQIHRPRAGDPALTYMVFDVLHLDGEDLRGYPFRFRYTLLEKMFEALGVIPAADILNRSVRLCEHHGADREEAERLVDEGYEGVVCKRWDSRYTAGKSGAWVKWKPDHEIEAVCTGTYEATEGSKYDGRAVGGITFRVSHPDGRVYDGRAAGMDDRLRIALYDDPSPYIGLVVELTHKGIGTDGALRHPQYRRFRDPADKEEAVVEPRPIREAPTAVATRRRQRNYKAMRAEKLMTCIAEFQLGSGDAVTRCIESGSGDLHWDLVTVLAIADEKGLI